jgi:hypothetical protein
VASPSAIALAGGPVLTITSIGGLSTPSAPTASFNLPDITLPASSAQPVTVTLAGTNIPPGTPVVVTVNGQTGGSASAAATLNGTLASTTASVAVAIPTNRPSVVSASATFTLAAAAALSSDLVVSLRR